MKTYRVNEIFYSVQGEGARAGSANVFIRFAGCNLTCNLEEHGFDCDTEFTSGVDMTAEDIAKQAREMGGKCEWVILTGGEPTLQLDDDLEQELRAQGFSIAIETNGTKLLTVQIDYVACSPKTAEHTLKIMRQVDELRYVRNVGMGIPKPKLLARRYYLSPAADADGSINRAALAHCVELCKEHPMWQLSVQQHKMWGVR